MAIGNNAYGQCLVTATGSGSALANSQTATSLLPTSAVYTIPANGFSYVGQKLIVEASGKISTTGTPTITFSCYLAGATWCASQAITTGSGISNVTWFVHFDMTIQALGNGTNANAMFTGYVLGIASATTLNMIPASSPVVSSGFNSTQANTLDFFGTWGTSSASNTITLMQYAAYSPN